MGRRWTAGQRWTKKEWDALREGRGTYGEVFGEAREGQGDILGGTGMGISTPGLKHLRKLLPETTADREGSGQVCILLHSEKEWQRLN